MTPKLLVTDPDIRMAIFFMTNFATVMLYMQEKIGPRGRDLENFDVSFFSRKISAYELVFEAVTEEFINDMFGPYANQVTRQTFKVGLQIHGWKFFEVKNLNELFKIKYDELVAQGTI